MVKVTELPLTMATWPVVVIADCRVTADDYVPVFPSMVADDMVTVAEPVF